MNGILINGVVWATRNIGNACEFVDKPEECGALYVGNEAHLVCPKGWHLPTEEEFNSLLDASDLGYKMGWGGLNGAPGYKIIDRNGNTVLFLPAAGYWDYQTNKFCGSGNVGCYWGRSVYEQLQCNLVFDRSTSRISYGPPALGALLRCVADK